jgi:hypothetical protein
MQPLLISLAFCILGIVVTFLLFGAAMGSRDKEAQPPRAAEPRANGFFLDEGVDPGPTMEPPTNALLLELEHRARTEHKAAESFVRGPSAESLHASPEPPKAN